MEVGKREGFIILLVGVLVTLLVISFFTIPDISKQDPIQEPEFSDVTVDDSYNSDITVVYDEEGEMVCYILISSDDSIRPVDCVPVEQTNYTSSDFKR